MRNVGQLRGQVWCIERSGAEKNAELVGYLIESRDEATLPPAFPIAPILERLFQERALVLPNTNPFPDRVIPNAATVPSLVLAEVSPQASPAELPETERKKRQELLEEIRRRGGRK